MNVDQWFPFEQERCRSLDMLFCFHHAGGTASVYRNWLRWSDRIQVMPVELPGKATRTGEPYAEDMDSIAEAVAGRIAFMISENPHRRITLYGHSMGAALAFLTAVRMEEDGICLEKLIVSGRHSPEQHIPDGYQTWMSDDRLVQEMRRIGGTPEELLGDPSVLEWILPPLKADYKINESFHYGGERLHCAIHAYAGSEDPDAPVERMLGWKRMTSGQFFLHTERGGHFFPIEGGVSYWKEIEADVLGGQAGQNV